MIPSPNYVRHISGAFPSCLRLPSGCHVCSTTGVGSVAVATVNKDAGMTIGESRAPESKVWSRILRASLALPAAKVDRSGYLRSQLLNYCSSQQVQDAIDTRPALAGVPSDLINKLADSSIKRHVAGAASVSFATGLPGGWAMAATIPADLAQYYWHAIVLAQKLAYLYGWPDLFEDGEFDEETEMRLTLLVGAMMGAREATRLLSEIARRFAEEAARRIPRQTLTKTAYYPVVKLVGKWIGVRVTKQSFGRGVAKVVPIAGGVISAGVTTVMMLPMAKQLKNHLKTTRFATADEPEQLRSSDAPHI